MNRLIDLMCARHRDQVLETMLWAGDTADCYSCTNRSAVALLPHLDQQRCIAVHEAGHAVAYLIVGERVIGAYLHPDGRGGVNFVARQPQPAAVWAGPSALRHMLALSGPVSDTDLVDVAATGGVGANSDAVQLRAMAGQGIDITAARDAADTLVADHWDAIDRVAGALLDRGRLAGAEVAAVAGLDVGCLR